MAASIARLRLVGFVRGGSARGARLCTAVARPAHELLGVPPDAGREHVERAYLDLALARRARRGADAAAQLAAAQHLEALGRAYDELTGATPRPAKPRQGSARALGPTSGANATLLPDVADSADNLLIEQLVPSPAYVPPPLRRLAEWMRRLPDTWDQLLGHTYDSLIHKFLREDNLTEAFACFAEMKAEGQPPTAATYEMLIRGCTLAMVRVTPEEPEPDRLTLALYNRVLELWSEMRARKIRVDRYTYTELMRACGKAGQLDAAFALFFKMLSLPQFLPDERAFDSMYEVCTSIGAHDRALDVFREQSELRKSLFAPRFTPVSFTHLILAGVEGGQMHRLGGVLREMERVGCLPAVGTCAKLLGAALEQGELEVAEHVLRLTRRAGHAPDRLLLDAYEAAAEARKLGGAESGAHRLLTHGGRRQKGGIRRLPADGGVQDTARSRDDDSLKQQ